jgi:DNA-binding NtrC family response regulator
MKKTEVESSVPTTTVLAVIGTQEDSSLLHRLFAGSCWELSTVETVAAAAEWLNRNSAAIVLCERRLPDGDWRDLLRVVNQMKSPPPIVLTSRQADETLWTEALTLGVFDVLPFPAPPGELFGAISSAWRNWNQHRGDGHRSVTSASACRA